jgi:hypothetical protein
MYPLDTHTNAGINALLANTGFEVCSVYANTSSHSDTTSNSDTSAIQNTNTTANSDPDAI